MSLVVPFDEIFANKTGLLAKHASWERVELGRVTSILNGFPFKSSLFNKSKGFPVIRIRDLANSSTKTYYDGGVPSEYIVKKGDLLIGMDGNFRCCEWLGSDAGLNQRICKITPDEHFLDRQFLLYGLNGYLKAIEEVTSSVTVGHLSSRDVQRIPFPLPPLLEQRRIVAKLEMLLGKVETCQQRLAKIPVLLKRFRQSVLAAACSGRLTADWREMNGNGSYDFTTVDAIAEYIGGFAFKSPTFLETGKHQVIRIGNVRPLALKLDASPVFIPDKIAEQTQRFKLLPGDIAISMTGTKYKQDYGFAALVSDSDGSLFLNQRVARVRCSKSVLPKFLLFWFQTDACRESFFSGETGNVNQGNVGAGGIRNAPIGLPPLPEQQEIVRRVDALFALADQIEARFQKAKAHVDRLTPSILARAFRGELVSQDPNDEPAEKLLERIRESRGQK